MAGRRKTPPGEKTPMQKSTERVNKGREKISRARKKIDPSLPNESTRPSYKPEYAEQAMKLCLLNYTNEDLAQFFEVSLPTINNWIAEIPAFKASVMAGREEADMEVVGALKRLALGYEHPSEKIFYDAKTGQAVRVETVEKYAPNFNALQLWLCNRHKDRWKMASRAETEEGNKPGSDAPAVRIEGGLPDDE